jgi:hypothetical protein
MATLIDLVRNATKRWFVIVQYRDKNLREIFCAQYGIDVRLVSGAVTALVCSLYLHKHAIFVQIGKRYCGNAGYHVTRTSPTSER